MTLIRKATVADAPQILALIKGLADYERAPDQVKTTVEDLIRDGFGERPFFDCLLAIEDGRPVAMALYFFNWSTWTGRPGLYLEDLFVEPAWRGRKIGLRLLQRLAAIAVENHCERFEWVVLDWNQPAIDFYHRIGARHKEGWLPYRLDGEALRQFAAQDAAS